MQGKANSTHLTLRNHNNFKSNDYNKKNNWCYQEENENKNTSHNKTNNNNSNDNTDNKNNYKNMNMNNNKLIIIN